MGIEWSFKKSWIIATFLLVIFSGYNFIYRNQPWPNTYLGQDKVPGGDRLKVNSWVEEKINKFESTDLVFNIEGEKVSVGKQEAGIRLDRERTLSRVYMLGRSGNFGDDLLVRLKAPFVGNKLLAVYSIDFGQFRQALDRKLANYNRRAKDATIIFVDGKAQIRTGEVGRIVDYARLIGDIRKNIDNLLENEISVQLVEDLPKIEESEARAALEKVQDLQREKIVLSYKGDSWTLGGADLLAMLVFPSAGQLDGAVKFGLGDWQASLNWLKIDNLPSKDLEISMDSEKLGLLIVDIAKAIDRPTIDATLTFENGRVRNFRPAQDGLKLDQTQTKRLVLSKISITNQTLEETAVVTLPVIVEKARIANEEINNLGIGELIGHGESYFAGSIANRISNIILGASRITGAIVLPGEVFSFNNTVGEVSKATGYRQAYVIAEGRTVLDDGGGICQVSTTVFRAALSAGLPIVARTAHAYRVSYYEQKGYKPGFDATVWAPAVDMKFKNDTGHHLLIQATVDPIASKIVVDIYGTNDGRKVVISDPVLTDPKPALPDKYQDDPTLPKGTVKQVDFAANGITSTFMRKVYRDGQLVIDDVFVSNFRPWQAIYLVGTGT